MRFSLKKIALILVAIASLVSIPLDESLSAIHARKEAQGRGRPFKSSTVVAKKPTAKATLKPVVVQPSNFVERRVGFILRSLKARAPRQFRKASLSGDSRLKIPTPIWVTKTQWLQNLYRTGIVDYSKATGLLADKLLFYEVAKKEMGDGPVKKYLGKTVGLRDFLLRHHLVDSQGRLVASGDEIESKLYAEFPAGFIVRPAVGIAPYETGRGLFKTSDEFVMELVRPNSRYYRADQKFRPVQSSVLGEVASGEALVLQEDVLSRYLISMGKSASTVSGLPSKEKWREIRIHTYEGRVVVDADANQWIKNDKFTKDEIREAQNFVTGFLSHLSPKFLMRQAWSFDVLVMGADSNDYRITDVITNRGRRGGWSGYLDQPRVLGAYSRHFENYLGVQFTGLGGRLLRANAGNYFAYWGIKINKSRPGFDRVLAWIPPWP